MLTNVRYFNKFHSKPLRDLEQINLRGALSSRELTYYFKLESFGRSEIDGLFVEIQPLTSEEDQMNERKPTESPSSNLEGE